MPRLESRNIYCDITINDWDYTDDLYLEPNQTYRLLIDYPLTHPANFKITTGQDGMNYKDLVHTIVQKYFEVYRNGEKYLPWLYIDHLRLLGINIDHQHRDISLYVEDTPYF